MRITKPLAEQVFEAYCELFAAVENGINNENFFPLRERFRSVRQQVLENETSQEQLQQYRTFAHDSHNDDGHLEVDDSAVVSVSEDGGAYVEAWVWVPNESLPNDPEPVETNDETVQRFRNEYDCPCGEHWEDEWDSMCDDRCPECNTPCSPTTSHEI